jgi:CheY-like chemotaxis protein
MTDIKGRILWVDDEVELLRPHILFLEQSGYAIDTVTNGHDAVARMDDTGIELVLLDESMPGMGGLEALAKIKELRPHLPVVMVTKNEEESLMEEAIGAKIDDYVLKPVNPRQILSVLKKFLEGRRIRQHRTSQDYIREFNSISQALYQNPDLEQWIGIYRSIVEWSLELDQHAELGLQQTLADQRRECNQAFCRYVEKSYRSWIEDEAVTLSPQVVDRFVLPHLDGPGPVFFFVIDCMRLDQWQIMEQHLQELFTIRKDFYVSILPTATPYARNAIFSGYYPSDIERAHPTLWSQDDDDDNSMNKYEKEFLAKLLERRRITLRADLQYIKILESEFGKQIAANIQSYAKHHLVAIVLNFVDMLAHSRSDYAILKEIAPDEPAYRSLTNSWFMHSSLYAMFRTIARIPNAKVVVTSDHGSVRCLRGLKVFADREASTNLRYKFGRNIRLEDPKQAMMIRQPEDYRLPKRGITANYVIAKEDYYFVYPTDFNRFLARYRDSFQHGGISLEELILPVITMEAK